MSSGIFDPYLERTGIVILDGAMATELEKKGADLNHPLWSAKLLIENPAMIKQVHLDYLIAGADIITTASYQASFTGFAKHGYSRELAMDMLIRATSLAVDARDEMMQSHSISKPYPLIAASVGPYGASKADGSEYTGNYALSVEELMNFHRERMGVLAASGADLLAFETIPCAEEALAIIQLLKEFPSVKGWISFSCKNESMISSGTLFAECVAMGNQSDQVVAMGVNCTSPQYVESLIRIALTASRHPIIVYPNKGEIYDPHHKCWLPGSAETDFNQDAVRWRNAGARIIGGCCRTSPEDIARLKATISV